MNSVIAYPIADMQMAAAEAAAICGASDRHFILHSEACGFGTFFSAVAMVFWV
jgi:hypothetical protein